MTDNLNKADEELSAKLVDIFFKASGGISDMAQDEVNLVMQAIKQRDAIRDKAIQLEARVDEVELRAVLAAFSAGLGASEYESFMSPEERQRVNELRSLHPKYTLPGFENTMSDLDKLTVKPANEEERNE